MSTNTFRLQYIAKAAAGVPRDLVNTFINAKVHPIRPTVLIYNCTWVCDAKCTMCNNWKWGNRKEDMAAGRPISLLGGTQNDSEYGERSARVRTMYATPDAQAAWDLARALRIDYIWIDRTERTAYPSGMAKFEVSSDRFEPVFRNPEVAIYRVR